jgi:hypothetical protein
VVNHQPRPFKNSRTRSQGVALPLLGIWDWRLTGGRIASPSALRTGDESLALALGTNLARSNDNPGFIAGLASAFACETSHFSLPAATRTLHFIFAHRHPSFHPESIVNRDSQCSVGFFQRQIIRDRGAVHHRAATQTSNPSYPSRSVPKQHRTRKRLCHGAT